MVERRRLPPERRAVTRVFRLPHIHKDGTTDTMRFYFTAGLYEDGTLGEIFVKADKPGSLAAGTIDAVATLISLLLQHGVPLEAFLPKLKGTNFKPNGFTGDGEIKSCTSPLDLLARWLELKYGKKEDAAP